MKNVKGFILAALALPTLWLASCTKVVKDQTSAVVEEINDSVMVARTADGKVHFDIADAEFTNGAVMFGDSVVISYIGDLSKKRALAERIRLVPRPSPVIEVVEDTTKELKTRPADPKEMKEINRMLKAAKKFPAAE